MIFKGSRIGAGNRRPHRAAALVGLISIALAACGGTPASTSASGSERPTASRTVIVDGVVIPLSGDLRVAFFAPFLGNAAIQLVNKSIKAKVAAVPGATLTVFDANGSPTTQINQIQNAVQSKQYNVAFVIAADPVLACKPVTEDMPKAGILVGVFNTPMCDTWKNEGDQLRAPGTFAFIGGTHTIDYYTDYFTWIAKQNPGPQKVLVITAPQLNAIAQAIDIALKKVSAANPGFEVVDEAYTDYSVPMTFTKTQAMVQAHPDATILYTGYSTAAQGAVKALKAAGKQKSIKIYDKGGSQWAADAVRDGTIEATTPEAQATSANALMQLLIDAFDGQVSQPTVLLHDALTLLPGASPSGFEVFTKANIDLWKPEVA